MSLNDLAVVEFQDADVAFVDDEQALHSLATDDDEAKPGISFMIPEGFSRRECFILRQALYALSDAIDPAQVDMQFIFRRNEHRIHQAARRLMNSSPIGTPVIIGPSAFKQNSH